MYSSGFLPACNNQRMWGRKIDRGEEEGRWCLITFLHSFYTLFSIHRSSLNLFFFHLLLLPLWGYLSAAAAASSNSSGAKQQLLVRNAGVREETAAHGATRGNCRLCHMLLQDGQREASASSGRVSDCTVQLKSVFRRLFSFLIPARCVDRSSTRNKSDMALSPLLMLKASRRRH